MADMSELVTSITLAKIAGLSLLLFRSNVLIIPYIINCLSLLSFEMQTDKLINKTKKTT